MSRAALAVVVALALVGCSGDAETSDDPASASTTSSIASPRSTEPPDYSGDPDSAFCVEVADATDRPLLDPFEAGIPPTEIELRLRALGVRFRQLADLAPSELDEDVEAVVDALGVLEETLAEHDFDLGAAADADADLSLFDDPTFSGVAVRIAAYAEQVCR